MNNVDLPKGYYIIANVFSSKKNAENFRKKIKTKKIDSKTFIDPVSKYTYVYVKHLINKDEAKVFVENFMWDLRQGDIWILSVNNNETEENNTD